MIIQTYEFFPGGGAVSFLTQQRLPRVRLLQSHPLIGSFTLPHPTEPAAPERPHVRRVPVISHISFTLDRFFNKPFATQLQLNLHVCVSKVFYSVMIFSIHVSPSPSLYI